MLGQAIAAVADHAVALPARNVWRSSGAELRSSSPAYAAMRESAGHGETDAFAASEYRFGRRYDRVVAISRSGTTTEVLDTVGRIDGAAVTAITVGRRVRWCDRQLT